MSYDYHDHRAYYAWVCVADTALRACQQGGCHARAVKSIGYSHAWCYQTQLGACIE